jgi:putative oxidoreductase
LFGKLLGTKNDWVLTLIRIVAGGVMFPHGAGKLLGWFGGAGFSRTMEVLSHQGFPAPLVFLAICAEFFGALGLVLGCLSRIAAFSIVADMAVAAFVVNIHFGFFANWQDTKAGEGIEYHLLMMGMALAVMIWGGGAFSVDRALAASKQA